MSAIETVATKICKDCGQEYSLLSHPGVKDPIMHKVMILSTHDDSKCLMIQNDRLNAENKRLKSGKRGKQ
jgi:hypothetical protein